MKVEGNPEYREEKIDLPASWLRGFGQLQAAMALPSRKVVLPVEAIYSVLAFLRRHRERTGPRSLRFQLMPGAAPVLVLDPWGASIVCRGAIYEGDKPEEMMESGRRRLFALARLLPLCERVEVRLLGNGLPSIWIVHMGGMRFVLALSGWTANDWSGGAALEWPTRPMFSAPATWASPTPRLRPPLWPRSTQVPVAELTVAAPASTTPNWPRKSPLSSDRWR